MQLRREGRRPLAIGHRGAPKLAPENTLASLQAAVAAGVDVVEFDVLERGGELVLAHSVRETAEEPLPLDGALEWLSGLRVAPETPRRRPRDVSETSQRRPRDAPETPQARPGGARETSRSPFRPEHCGIHLDVKGAGFEERIVEALERYGLSGRAFVSTSRAPSLRRFAELAPALPRALSYPEDRLGVTRTPLAAPLVAVGLSALRRTLPARVGGMLGRAHATVASLHHTLLTRAAVARCHALGVPVIAWTVDEPERVEQLVALGVDAIVSNDPAMLLATLPP